MMLAESAQNVTNGLQAYAPLANLTAVGAMIVLIFWLICRALPKMLDRQDEREERREQANAAERAEFRRCLDRQAEVRDAAASSGHEAARAIAESLRELSREVRSVNAGHSKQSVGR